MLIVFTSLKPNNTKLNNDYEGQFRTQIVCKFFLKEDVFATSKNVKIAFLKSREKQKKF
jgi:hypothetical protein